MHTGVATLIMLLDCCLQNSTAVHWFRFACQQIEKRCWLINASVVTPRLSLSYGIEPMCFLLKIFFLSFKMYLTTIIRLNVMGNFSLYV